MSARVYPKKKKMSTRQQLLHYKAEENLVQ